MRSSGLEYAQPAVGATAEAPRNFTPWARTRRQPAALAQCVSGHPHVVHVHGHHFRLLDRLDDGWKPYWLDTLVVGDQVERIAFVADNPGKWLIDLRDA